MVGRALILKIGYSSISLGGTGRAICGIRPTMRGSVVSGSHFRYASTYNNISISHFTLTHTHVEWMEKTVYTFYLLGGCQEG